MSRFRNRTTGAVVAVADHKDERYGAEWELADERPAPAPAKKAAAVKRSTTKP